MLYRICVFVIGIYLYLFYRIKITGQENIPEKGGFILCSNHISVKDPPLLGASIKRPICFLAKKELFSNKIFNFVFKKLGAIPVDRKNADMSTYKSVIAELRNGKCVGIFAQGTRMKEIEAENAKSGVALFALKANVPVIPVCISGSYKHFSKLYVNIGKPIYLDEYRDKKIKSEGLKEITEIIMNNIAELSKL